MKMLLKKFREEVLAAKTAWLAARTGKKTAEAISAARESYEVKFSLLEHFEADGKKDDDEIEVPAEKDADNVLDTEALQLMITKSVEDTLKKNLDDAQKGQVKTEDIERIVAAQFAKFAKENGKEAITQESVKAMTVTVVAEALEGIKNPSKMKHSKAAPGGGDDDRSQIEMPYSLSKGNLPLHMKQLLNCLLRKSINDGVSASQIADGAKLGDAFHQKCAVEGCKALTSTGSGTGADFVPRDLSSELHRRMYLESRIAQMMLGRQINMPTDPYDMPLSTTRPTFYANNVQNREARGSTPGTGKTTLTTKKFMALVQYSYEADEDSIIPLLPLLQTLLGEAAAQTLEAAIINGDVTATHQDSDITDVDDIRKQFAGLRKLALAVAGLKVDMSTGGVVRSNLLSLKRALGKWGRNPNDLAWIVGALGENHFLNLDDVVTADKRGATPTSATGVINSYLGIPILVSEENREDLNASGVFDNTTTTKGSIILANLNQFILGSRRDFTVEVDRNIKSQTNDIVASFRKDFKPVETPSASIKTVAIGYNYTA